MSNLKSWFDKGMSSHTYISSMQVNKDNLLKVYNEFSVPAKDIDSLKVLQTKGFKALILSADWCGDAMVNVPIFLRLANEALIETRFLIRDENLELMDQFLTNGTARSIPIIIFLNENDEVIGKWGPRAELIQKEVDVLKKDVPAKDSPEYDAAFKSFIKAMVEQFINNKDWWTIIKTDLIESLTALEKK
ncbi:thioredoxin family protein [Niallia circulans]|uniref:Thioredoxin family protein n=1 Tax=Niallia circulans TaxID=1397 RepID=A0A553SM31_NIACI|nr:thioredoxin family protein [Niallia circulans]TRZ38050.1 thioredoxin family protein [Niallia circulans]